MWWIFSIIFNFENKCEYISDAPESLIKITQLMLLKIKTFNFEKILLSVDSSSDYLETNSKLINIYIYIYIYVVHSISFQTFFVLAFKIVVDSWQFSMLLLYIFWDDWPIFIISGSNQLEYTLLKPDCHSWWISKMQSGREDTLEERYAIKFCFKLEKKMPQKGMEYFRLLFDHFEWIEHQFLSGIRDSRKVGSLWGMMWVVGE